MGYINDDGERIREEQELVKIVDVDGTEIDVLGFNWNVERERWEHHDLFHGTDCLNLGEPWGPEPPTDSDVREFVREIHPEILEGE